jgi:hypothetical protein
LALVEEAVVVAELVSALALVEEAVVAVAVAVSASDRPSRGKPIPRKAMRP